MQEFSPNIPLLFGQSEEVSNPPGFGVRPERNRSENETADDANSLHQGIPICGEPIGGCHCRPLYRKWPK
jgi:hypothetical protein